MLPSVILSYFTKVISRLSSQSFQLLKLYCLFSHGQTAETPSQASSIMRDHSQSYATVRAAYQPAHKYLVDHGDCQNLERTAHDDVARQLPRGAHSGPTALRRVSRAARASPPRPRARSERTVEDLCGAIFFVGCVGWVFPFPAGARARRAGPSISAGASTASRHLVSRASAAGANAIRERRARPR